MFGLKLTGSCPQEKKPFSLSVKRIIFIKRGKSLKDIDIASCLVLKIAS